MIERLPRRRIALTVLLLAAAILLLMIFYPTPQRPMLPHGVLRVGVDGSYPPFGIDLGGEFTGLDVDIARALAAEIGAPVQFVGLGYDGLYDALRTDQVDVVIAALRVNPQMMADVRYTRHYFDAGQVLVRPTGSALNTMRDMDGLAVAVEFGGAGDEEARVWQRRLHQLTLAEFATADAALTAVQDGEADAALVDAVAARLWRRDHDGLTIAPEYVTHDPYAAAVRLDNTRLAEALDAALGRLIDSGELARILARWL